MPSDDLPDGLDGLIGHVTEIIQAFTPKVENAGVGVVTILRADDDIDGTISDGLRLTDVDQPNAEWLAVYYHRRPTLQFPRELYE